MFLYKTLLIVIYVQIIRFLWIILKPEYALDIKGGPISNLKLKNTP